MHVDLIKLLEWITDNVYRPMGESRAPSRWVVGAGPLIDHLAEQAGIGKEEMGRLFDEARYRVHGEHLRAQDQSENN